MAQTAWINVMVASAGGKHTFATSSGDQGSSDICISYDPVRVPATTPLAGLMDIIRTGFLSRGFKP
jgi:hypothetical protein